MTIGGADATFLKISDANSKFLPIADANAKFLQGVSGAATLSRNARQVLLSIPGFGVDVATNGDGFPSVTINDGTGVALPAVQDQGGRTGASRYSPGITRSLSPCRMGSTSCASRPSQPPVSAAC